MPPRIDGQDVRERNAGCVPGERERDVGGREHEPLPQPGQLVCDRLDVLPPCHERPRRMVARAGIPGRFGRTRQPTGPAA